MDIRSEMRPFFYPRAVAVVGVSRDPWKFGSATFISLQKFGSTIPIYPVSNRMTEFKVSGAESLDVSKEIAEASRNACFGGS